MSRKMHKVLAVLLAVIMAAAGFTLMPKTAKADGEIQVTVHYGAEGIGWYQDWDNNKKWADYTFEGMSGNYLFNIIASPTMSSADYEKYAVLYFLDEGFTDEVDGGFRPTEDCEIWVKYSPSYIMTFYANNGSTGDASYTTYPLAQGKALDYAPWFSAPDNHFQLTHWTENQDGTGASWSNESDEDNYIASGELVPTGDMEFWAQWTPTWTMTYVDIDGIGGTDTAEVGQGHKIGYAWVSGENEADPNKILTGYSTEPNGQGTIYSIRSNQVYPLLQDLVPEGDMTFYAYWESAIPITLDFGEEYFLVYSWETEQVEEEHSATFLIPEGTELGDIPFGIPDSVDASHGVRELFYRDAAFTQELDRDFVPTASMTVYVRYLGSATVTFYKNDGTDTSVEHYFEEGEEIGWLPEDAVFDSDDEHLAISAYNTKPDGSGTSWSLDSEKDNYIGNLVPQKGGTDLYAEWGHAWVITETRSDNSMYFKGENGARLASVKVKVPDGQSFGDYMVYPRPSEEREGNPEFGVSFYTDKACTREIDGSFVPTKDQKVYTKGAWFWRVFLLCNDGLEDGSPRPYSLERWLSYPVDGGDDRTWPNDGWKYYEDEAHQPAGYDLKGYSTEKDGSGTFYSADPDDPTYLGNAKLDSHTLLWCQWELASGEEAVVGLRSVGGRFTINDGNHWDGKQQYYGKMNVTLSPGAAQVTVTAIPDRGYRFVGWYEGVEGTSGFIEGHTDRLLSADAAYTFVPGRYTGLDAVFEDQVVAFVTRLYQVCLGREPDAGGLNNWVSQLKAKKITGIQAAYGFIFSAEFQNKNLCNRHFVQQLYRAFMGREPDEGGWNSWIRQLESGKKREEVFNGFALSKEFNNLCSEYGISQGKGISIPQYGTVPKGNCSVCGEEDGVTAFVKRLYAVCLDREADAGGLKNWTNQLWSHKNTGKATARGFVFSAEFQNKKHSNEKFVEYMYKAFFGREADAGGKANWVKQLNAGKSREFVFNGFADSAEFTNLCNRYGITAR